jgi:hypothetical protein
MNRFKLRLVGLIVTSLLIAMAAVWTGFDIKYSRELHSVLADLKTQGYPLAAAEIRPQPVPNDRNAALVYLRVFPVKFDTYEVTHGAPKEVGLDDVKLPVSYRTSLAYALSAQPVLQSRKVQRDFALLKEASLRPDCVFPIRWEKGFGATFPHLRQFRQAARLVALQAIIEAHEGDLPQALDWLTVCYRMADHASREPSLIAMLVARAMCRVADAAAQVILSTADISAETASPLQKQLANMDFTSRLTPAIRTEMAMGVDAAIHLGARDLRDLKEATGSATWPWTVAMVVCRPWINHDRAYYAQTVAARIALSSGPFRDYRAPADAAGHVNRLCAPISSTLLPAMPLRLALIQRDETTASLGLLQTALSVKAYKHDHGSYPNSLSDLKDTLTDPFSGEPFVYRRDGEGFILYSIGHNLKDDRGTEALNAEANTEDADIVWRSAR